MGIPMESTPNPASGKSLTNLNYSHSGSDESDDLYPLYLVKLSTTDAIKTSK